MIDFTDMMPAMTKGIQNQMDGLVQIKVKSVYISLGTGSNHWLNAEEIKSLDDMNKAINALYKLHLNNQPSKGEYSDKKGNKYFSMPFYLWRKYDICFTNPKGKILYAERDQEPFRGADDIEQQERGITWCDFILCDGAVPTMEQMFYVFNKSYSNVKGTLQDKLNDCYKNYPWVTKDTPCFMDASSGLTFYSARLTPINPQTDLVIDRAGFKEVIPQKTDTVSQKLVDFMNTKKIVYPATFETIPCITNVVLNQNQRQKNGR